ncbi:MAG: MarR family winged helix-turn-helix transcriptional regulator [Terriglobales bacterium]
MPSKPYSGLYFNWKFFQSLRQHLAQALEPLHLPVRDFFLLSVMRQQPCSQRELAAICGLDPSSMVPVVDALERRGWIVRQRDPRDRRVHLVTLSTDGRALHTCALALAKRVEAQQMSRLTETERTQLSELLRKLVDV